MPGVSGKGLLIGLLTSKPWLIPILYNIHRLQGASIQELRELLGLKTSVVRRGVWWLSRVGVVVKSGEKLVVEKNYRKTLDELLLNTCTTGKEYVVKIGKTYYVAVVRRTYITAYTLPEKILEDFMNRKIENRTVKDLSIETGYPPRLVARTLRLYKILEECRS